MNQNYDIKIKILSPVHIGAGTDKNWQQAADYVHTRGFIYVLDQRKVWLGFSESQKQKYLDGLSTGRFADVERLIIDNLDLKAVSTNNFEYNGRMKSREIKTLIRDGLNQPYIPGSSIKGAISSALFNYLYSGLRPTYYNDKTANEILGTFDKALGRFIRPSDATLSNTQVDDVDLYNLYQKTMGWVGEYKDGFRIILETFGENQEGSMRLSFAMGLADFILKQKGTAALPTHFNKTLGEKPLENIFKIVNNYTRTQLMREIEYFEKYNDVDDVNTVLNHLDELLKKLNAQNEQTCILRLSFGSGFHGITGDWRFSDHTSTILQPDTKNLIYNRETRMKEPARYKSRRLVFPYTGLMGFIQLEAKTITKH